MIYNFLSEQQVFIVLSMIEKLFVEYPKVLLFIPLALLSMSDGVWWVCDKQAIFSIGQMDSSSYVKRQRIYCIYKCNLDVLHIWILKPEYVEIYICNTSVRIHIFKKKDISTVQSMTGVFIFLVFTMLKVAEIKKLAFFCQYGVNIFFR